MQDHQLTHWLDAISVGTIVATLAGWLPAMAALASLVWSLIRIYETKTVQSWLKRWK
ncbi:hypothetical protein ACO0K9_12245 [Undibacterium sp. Ji50W]|uniref:hypothetical protein n=1 Tax=Undibacterium sp. Ji50W TaxID=3413041 RepID=UPI003BF234CB